MKLIIDERWRVTAMHDVLLPLTAGAVWGRMRDLRTFLTMDPLHARVRTADDTRDIVPPVGTPLVIEHRLLGIGVDRAGRLLQWREGRSFAVSDLSKRGAHVGFPHVCRYEVEPNLPLGSRLRITVRGRWTLQWMPRTLAKLWLWWVMFNTGWRIAWYFRCQRPQNSTSRAARDVGMNRSEAVRYRAWL